MHNNPLALKQDFWEKMYMFTKKGRRKVGQETLKGHITTG